MGSKREIANSHRRGCRDSSISCSIVEAIILSNTEKFYGACQESSAQRIYRDCIKNVYLNFMVRSGLSV